MKTSLLAIALATGTFAATSLSARPEGAPPRPNPEDMVIEMFTDYDANENNALSQTELVAAFQGMQEKRAAAQQDNKQGKRPNKGKRGGPPPAEEHAERLIQDFDADADSELSTEELLAAFTTMHEGQGRPGRRGKPTDEAAE